MTTANHKISHPVIESGLLLSASQARNVSFDAFNKTYNSNILKNASVSGAVGSTTNSAEGISSDQTTKSSFMNYFTRATSLGKSLNSSEHLATTPALQEEGLGAMIGTLNVRQVDQEKLQMAPKEEDTNEVETTTSLVSHTRQFSTLPGIKVMEHNNNKSDDNIKPTISQHIFREFAGDIDITKSAHTVPLIETFYSTGSYGSASSNTSFKHEDETTIALRQYEADMSTTLSAELENVKETETSKNKNGVTEVTRITPWLEENDTTAAFNNQTNFTVTETYQSFVENDKGARMKIEQKSTQGKSDTTANPIRVPMFREIDICLLARRKDGNDSKLVEIPCTIPSQATSKPSALIRLCGISTSVWDVTMAYNSKCQNLNVTKEDEDRLLERGLSGINNGKIVDIKMICIVYKRASSFGSFDICPLEDKLVKDASNSDLFKLASHHCGLHPRREHASISIVVSKYDCRIPLEKEIVEWNGVYLWLLFSIACIGIAGNSFSIYLFYKGGLERSGQSNPAVYFTTMLTFDIINLVTKVIRCLVLLNVMRPLNPVVCRLSIGIQPMVSVGSMLSIIALTVERYIAVCHPLKAKFLLTKSRQNKVRE